jgi:hypothetical protein
MTKWRYYYNKEPPHQYYLDLRELEVTAGLRKWHCGDLHSLFYKEILLG